MPPGGGRFRGGGRGGYARATVAGVLNATAETDDQARATIFRIFGPLLALVMVCDVGSAFAMLYLQCTHTSNNNNNSSNNNTNILMAECLQKKIADGFHFQALNDDGLGDLFVLAVIRCVGTLILLWAGVYFGQPSSSKAKGGCWNNKPTTRATSQDSHDHDDDEFDDEPPLASLSAPLLEHDHEQDDAIATSLENQASSSHPKKCCSGRRLTVSAAVVKNASLIVLFVTSAVYQIYAGLKVSTFPMDQSTTGVVTLMCLSVLWINVAAQLFRTILLELTRDDGMFLSPEIHRHP
eukprot:scaffold178446_cov34-Attheya_sp.AAC.1